MTNSLSLRQCHLPGQSSFLFSKCFSRFPQSLKDQKDTFFIPVHAITIPQYPTHSKFRSSLFPLRSPLSDSIPVGSRASARYSY